MRATAAVLLLSLPSAALFSLPASSRSVARPRCAATLSEAATASPVLSEWDSKKPIHVDTWVPKEADMDNRNKQWWIIDATDMRLGRMATEIAKRLMGKHKVTYFPGSNVGDYVIVVNAEKVLISGNKAKAKTYFRHSGRPGGTTIETFEQLQARIPERIVEKAVKGMLPKGVLGREQFRHLKVFAGADHPHEAQSPVPVEWPEGSLATKKPTGKKMKRLRESV